MRKKLSAVLIAGSLLMIVISGLATPVFGSSIQHFGIGRGRIVSTLGLISTTITENITLADGETCGLNLTMTVSSSQLSQIFRELLDFDGDIQATDAKPIPELVNFTDDVMIPGEVGYTNVNTTNYSSVSVRDILLEGIRREHELSLGIYNMTVGVNETWGISEKCVIDLDAVASVNKLGLGEVAVGPLDWGWSLTRAGFILSKIGHIQQMLKSFDGEQIYKNVWTIHFELPNDILNEEDLNGKRWSQDFGNGTSLEAELAVTGNKVVELCETFLVAEKTISVTPEELLEDDFLCYKVFKIEYGPGGGQAASNAQSTFHEGEGGGEIRADFDPTWSMTVLDEEFTYTFTGDNSSVTFHVHPRLTLSGHVGWDFEWFKLEEFEAWTGLGADVNVTIDAVKFKAQNEWEKLLIERSRRKFFMVGYIPVELNINFTVTACLGVQADVEINVDWWAFAHGSIKVGVVWERGEGWYPIHRAGMKVDLKDDFSPSSPEAQVSITPGVAFRLTLLFYEAAGPFVQIKPYATLTLYSSGPPNYAVTAGVKVSAGIAFGMLMKKIFDLDNWEWDIKDFVLWQCKDCTAEEQYDVAVVDLRAPTTAFRNEPVNVTVDVRNFGEKQVDVNVTLSYEADGTSGTVDPPPKQIIGLGRGKMETLNFIWNTTTLPVEAKNYTLNATATITDHQDDDSSDNSKYHIIRIEVRNVRVTDITVSPNVVLEGFPVYINVTVENNGSVLISSLPVFVYYDYDAGLLIGDLWCEYIGVAFSITPYGGQKVLTFRWDTEDVGEGNYSISVSVNPLLYEIDYDDNFAADDEIVQVAGTPETFNIAVTDVQPRTTCVRKGCTMKINVTVRYEGNYSSILFDVTAYANASTIDTKMVLLEPGQIENVTFAWNTTGRETMGARYIISAHAHEFPGETNTTDNTYINGEVRVTWSYDVTGDNYCGIDDIVAVAEHFGQDPDSADWNPIYDINGDDYVGIDDIVDIAEHFGQECP